MKRATANGSTPTGAKAIRPAADSRRAPGKVESTAKQRANRARNAIAAFKNS
jgi:hypothetical protein